MSFRSQALVSEVVIEILNTNFFMTIKILITLFINRSIDNVITGWRLNNYFETQSIYGSSVKISVYIICTFSYMHF